MLHVIVVAVAILAATGVILVGTVILLMVVQLLPGLLVMVTLYTPAKVAVAVELVVDPEIPVVDHW